MFRRALSTLLVFALTVVGLTAIEVSSPPSAVADTATGGGKYVNQIDWMNWSEGKTAAGQPLPIISGSSRAIVEGSYVEATTVPGYTIRATIGAITATKGGSARPSATALMARTQDESYSDIQAKIGGTVHGYNTGTQVTRLVPRENGLRTQFPINFSIYRNGVLVANEFPDVIAADGENLNSNENISFTTTGTAWRNVENVGYMAGKNRWSLRSGTTNGGFGTQTFGALTSAGVSVPMGMTRGASRVSVDINSSGLEDVLLGFLTMTDHGDAPESYGDAAHVTPWSVSGPDFPSNRTEAQQPKVVLDTAAGPYLGNNPPDAEGAFAGAAWTGDDDAGDYNGTKQADESWSQLIKAGQIMPTRCGAPEYTLRVNTKNANAVGNAPAKTVAAWADWNGDGDFNDAGERTQATVANDTAILSWKNMPAIKSATVGMRFRIASNATDLANPTGLAGDGEVEDHLVNVTACALTLEKTADLAELNAANKTVTYSFKVTNTGQLPLTDVKVADPLLGAAKLDVAPSLAAGESKTITRSYTVDQAFINAGAALKNTATAEGKWTGPEPGAGDDATLTAQGSVTVPVNNTSTLTLKKALDQTAIPGVGGKLNYTFVVTNSGNVPLANVKVSDPALDAPAVVRGTSNTSAALAPSEQLVFTGSRTVTQADVDSAKFTNTAEASGTRPDSGSTLSASDSTATPFEAKPGVTLSKSGALSADQSTITYTFAATNSGNLSLNKVAFTDALLKESNAVVYDVAAGKPKLAPGEVFTFTRTYPVTQADITAGQVVNTATAAATPVPEGSGTQRPVVESAPATATVKIKQSTSLTLAKAATVAHADHEGAADTIDAAGDTVSYSFTVQNTGNIAVNALKFTDELLGVKGSTPELTALGGTQDGQIITELAPGQKATFTADLIVTQAMIDSGKKTLDNTATLTGTPVTALGGVDPPLATSNTVKTPLAATSGFTITKELREGEAPASTPRALGSQVNYRFVVKNTGRVTLSDLTFSDDLLGIKDAAVTGLPLAPGQSVAMERPYIVTQADVNAGEFTNVASVRHGEDAPVSSNAITVKTKSVSEISLSKDGVRAPADRPARAGDTLNYTLTLKNTGTTDVTDPRITDAALGLDGVRCAPAGTAEDAQPVTLAPGASCIVTGTRSLTQADVDAGEAQNSATAAATSPAGEKLSAKASKTLPTKGSSALSLVKTGSSVIGAFPGMNTIYAFTVTNTGSTTLKNVAITDPMYQGGAPLAVTPATLAPGTNGTAVFMHQLTAAEIEAGQVVNTATATGKAPQGYEDAEASASVTTEALGIAMLLAAKSFTLPDGPLTKAGQRINYSVTVHNMGSVSVQNVRVADLLAVTEENPQGFLDDPAGGRPTLAPQSSATFSFTYTVTQEDIDAGQVINVATASGSAKNPQIPVADVKSNTTTTPIKGAPALSIAKALDQQASQESPSKAGQKLVYALTLTNNGDTTLRGIKASDAAAGVDNVTLAKTELKPGQSTTGTVEYVLTQADIDRGDFVNVATANATSANGAEVPEAVSGEVRVGFPAAPAFTVNKVSKGKALGKLGDTQEYTVTVKNTGNVTLKDAVATDPGATPASASLGTLAPGESKDVDFTRTVTQADIDGKELLNTAHATAAPVRGEDPGQLSSPQVSDPIDAAPDFTVTKTVAEGLSVKAAGDVVPFTITVTNSGPVTLHQVLVTDPLLKLVNEPLLSAEDAAAGLAPGASASITREHRLTQAEVDAGVVNNQASATVVPAPAHTAPAAKSASASQQIAGEPAFTLSKKGAPKGTLSKAGDTVEYTLTLTNTGTVTLLNPQISDPKLGLSKVTPEADGAPLASLKPGQSATVKASWTLTQDEVDAGSVSNDASATVAVPEAYEPQAPEQAKANETLPIEASSSLVLKKESAPVAGTEITAAGQVLRYTLSIKNTGSSTLRDARVNDPMFGNEPLAAAPSTLAPGQVGVASFDHVVTQAEADAGRVRNTATAYATPPGESPEPVSGAASDTATVNSAASLKVSKTAVKNYGGVPTASGDVLDYTITVTNTGATTLSGVTATDALLSLKDVPVGNGTLAPGASAEVRGSYTLTQDDVDAGSRSNTASAVGTPPRGLDAVKDSTTLKTPIAATSAYTLSKAATVLTDDQVIHRAGDKIRYTLTLRNVGTTRLDGLSLSDPMASGKLTLTPATVEPGATATASFEHTATQADLDAGSISNQASATATAPGAEAPLPAQDSNTVVVQTSGKGSLSIQKDASGTPGKAGDAISYMLTVTNNGALSVTDAAVRDPLHSGGADLAVSPSSLAPGASGTAAFTYTLTQADVDAGEVVNTATARAKAPGGTELASPPSNTVTVPVAALPSLETHKTWRSADDSVLAKKGQEIEYTLQVLNTGNVTLKGATVSDPLLGLKDAAVKPSTLAPGESGTLTATYTLTQDDVDAGQVLNTATGTATAPGAEEPLKPVSSGQVRTPINGTASFTVVKTATPPAPGTISAPGDTIDYKITVTNTGTRTLGQVLIKDPLFGDKQFSQPGFALAPGDTAVWKPEYTLTRADVDRGHVDNTATARATAKGEDAPLAELASNTVTIPLAGQAALAVTKQSTAGVSYHRAGDVIEYTVNVTNTGTLTLNNVLVTDAGADEHEVALDEPLPAGESTSVKLHHTLTQEEVDARTFSNTAFATGTPPAQGGTEPEPLKPVASNTVTTPISPSATLTLKKSAAFEGELKAAGQVVSYTLLVTNTGDATLTDPLLSDQRIGMIPTLWQGEAIAPGATFTREVQYTLTQADVDAGTVLNTATAAATPLGQPTQIPEVSSNEVTVEIVGDSKLSIIKRAVLPGEKNPTAAGDRISYVLGVKNEGTTTLHSPTVSDPLLGLKDQALAATSLAPGAEGTIEVSYTLTQEDVDAGEVLNTASGAATPPRAAEPITGASDQVRVAVDPANALRVGKQAVSADGTALVRAGQEIEYTLRVVNVGSSTLRNAVVSDPMLGLQDAAVKPSTLAPGQSGELSVKHTLTQEEIDSLSVYNQASGTATPPLTDTPLEPGTAEVITGLFPTSSLLVAKRHEPLDPERASAAGDTITYYVDVTNNGTRTLVDVTVADPLIDDARHQVGDGTLAPGANATVELKYTLTQADVDAGVVDNTASATASPKGGGTEVSEDSNPLRVGLNGSSALSVLKERTGEALPAKAGDVIEYKITLTNTGTRTLSELTVKDPGSDEGTAELEGTLAPGASTSVTLRHTVTQAEADAGTFANTATATALPPTTQGQEPPARLDPAASNTVDTPIQGVSRLSVEKSAKAAGQLGAAGDKIEYTLKVTNTGDTTLSAPSVSDPMHGPDPVPVAASLAPGESAEFSFTHALTQEEVDAGEVSNTATATAASPSGAQLGETASNTVITPIKGANSIGVAKAGKLRGAGTAEQFIDYTVTVTNTGTTTLEQVSVDDPLVGAKRAGVTPARLAPGESGTVSFTHRVSKAQLAAGKVKNTATATALNPTAGFLDPVASNTVVTKVKAPAIDVGGVDEERPPVDPSTPVAPIDPSDPGQPGRPEKPSVPGENIPLTGAAVLGWGALALVLLLGGAAAMIVVRRKRE